MTNRLRLALLIIPVLLLGVMVGRWSAPAPQALPTSPRTETGPTATPAVYTCSMHPQIRSTDPKAHCPLCGMPLIPVASTGSPSTAGARRLSLTTDAAALAGIRTAPVRRSFAEVDVRLWGTLDYDETAVKTISAWAEGRLERLFVDYTGISIRAGEHLIELYSPQLYAAQQELLSALRTGSSSPGAPLPPYAAVTVDAARTKLQLLGLTPDQIAAIERRREARTTLEIRSPLGGVVIRKHASEGDYVRTGSPIYSVADLSRLWVRLYAYESDLAFLRLGEDVDVTTLAYGHETFTSRISFLDPILDPTTRTVDVRAVLANVDGRLKPGMLVQAVVHARVGEAGHLAGSPLAGLWMCPMHPEVTTAVAGRCKVCGMPLERAESLGHGGGGESRPALLVPASAVLLTGLRAVVYRRVEGSDDPTFEGLDVELGPKAGDDYVVRSGLSEGDLVAVAGAFKIDASLQLAGKHAMMTPPGSPIVPESPGMAMPPEMTMPPEALPTPVRVAMDGATAACLDASASLADDDEGGARRALERQLDELGSVPADQVPQASRDTLAEAIELQVRSLTEALATEDMAALRTAFAAVTTSTESSVRSLGHGLPTPIQVMFCPMALEGAGARWLQRPGPVANPFYGSTMLRCGEVRAELGGRTP